MDCDPQAETRFLAAGLFRHGGASMAACEAAVAALPQPFDRMLLAAPDSAERQAGEAAVTALQELGAGLRDAGTALGVLVIVSGV